RRLVWMRRIIGGLMLAALVLTNSRSTILGVMGAMTMSWLVVSNMGIFGVLAALVLGTGALAVLLQPELAKSVIGLFADLFARSGSVQEITSFTGRSDIWKAFWQLIQDKPLLGYGF